MKALILEYPFMVLLTVLVILVSVSMVVTIFKPEFIPVFRVRTDVRYACLQYNKSDIKFENFKTVLYGFLTEQCSDFSATLKEGLSFDDIARAVKEIDENVQVLKISTCNFPETNTYTVYICCKDFFEAGEKINIMKKEIKNSDVLVCGLK